MVLTTQFKRQSYTDPSSGKGDICLPALQPNIPFVESKP